MPSGSRASHGLEGYSCWAFENESAVQANLLVVEGRAGKEGAGNNGVGKRSARGNCARMRGIGGGIFKPSFPGEDFAIVAAVVTVVTIVT